MGRPPPFHGIRRNIGQWVVVGVKATDRPVVRIRGREPVAFEMVQLTQRSRDIFFLAMCCAATFALKLWSHEARVTPGHGDTAYYFHVAQNLHAGRGFVCDYVWSFLENPSATVPAPSHAWWMPGPSVIAWLGMLVAGAPTYTAAKVAMALFTSLFPLVVWFTAIRCFRDRTIAIRATLPSVAFHPFIDQPSAPLSQGPYGVIVGAALALLAGGRSTRSAARGSARSSASPTISAATR